MIAIVILIILAILVLWVIVVYNNLVRLKNRTEEAWSDIDVQLKRRHNLIPNLVETVKGYAAHEKKVLTDVTEARTRAMSAEAKGDVRESAQAENMLAGALKSLFAVAENYPNLKANQNFLSLQEDLTDTENKIQAARRFYNANARDFNIKQETFPSNIIAKIFGFKKAEFFEVEEETERKTPEVKF